MLSATTAQVRGWQGHLMKVGRGGSSTLQRTRMCTRIEGRVHGGREERADLRKQAERGCLYRPGLYEADMSNIGLQWLTPLPALDLSQRSRS